MYVFENGTLKVVLNDNVSDFSVFVGNSSFKAEAAGAYYTDSDGKRHLFSEMQAKLSEINDENRIGIIIEYAMFSASKWTNSNTSELHFDIPAGDDRGEIDSVCWPAPFCMEYSEQGYAVLPVMQGMLIHDSSGEAHNLMDGRFYSREATMPWWGQRDAASGYMATVETPWDAGIDYSHSIGESTRVCVRWIKSLGKMSYRRSVVFRFFDEEVDYTAFCKCYRSFLDAGGQAVTLAEKAEKTESVKKLVGSPVFNSPVAYYKIEPESTYYNSEAPEKNSEVNLFEDIADGLKRLHKIGVKKAYLHLDGWGLGGYDNLCPRVLPPSPEAGGADGLKKIIRTCKDLGYLLAYHDQYRDYYLKSPDYDQNNAVMREDGGFDSSEDVIWYGGIESQLCAKRALYYVRRNYDEMKKTGLLPDGVYLDVFSASILDECFSPEHPMTRRECVDSRGECFDYLHESGLIASSEEVMGAFINKLDLVHHSPYIYAFFDFLNRKPFGTAVPLLNLVYHDCILIPWAFADSGVWGLPENESGILHCLLNGGLPAVNFALKQTDIPALELICRLNEEVAFARMTSHEILNSSAKLQKTVFSTGTSVTVDFESGSYNIKWADGSITEGKRP